MLISLPFLGLITLGIEAIQLSFELAIFYIIVSIIDGEQLAADQFIVEQLVAIINVVKQLVTKQ